MPDILIRGVTVEDVAWVDAQAARAGLSRTEYLRRWLRQSSQRSTEELTLADLESLAERCGDLGDPEVMGRAWS